MLRRMSKPKVRAAVYVRVSTDEQDYENQLPALEQMAAARGHEIVKQYAEKMSGTKTRRPQLTAMMEGARRGEFSVVYVWAIDRLGRSMPAIVDTIMELDRLGVATLSYQEGWLDMPSAVRPLLISVFGWVAQQERERLVERTKAGMARAVAAGKVIGRPRANIDLNEVLRMRKAMMSYAEIGKKFHVTHTTIMRLLANNDDVPESVKTPTGPTMRMRIKAS